MSAVSLLARLFGRWYLPWSGWKFSREIPSQQFPSFLQPSLTPEAARPKALGLLPPPGHLCLLVLWLWVSATSRCLARSPPERCGASISNCLTQTRTGWSEWPSWTLWSWTPAQQQLPPDHAEGSRGTWKDPRTRQVLRPMLPSEMWKSPRHLCFFSWT